MLQHRALPKTHLDQVKNESLLPLQQLEALQEKIKITPKQLQKLGALLIVLVLMFVCGTFYGQMVKWQRHDLSSCSDRLAAVNLELSAAALLSGGLRFPTSGSDAANIWEHALDRHALYGDLSTDMQRKGLQLGGAIAQGLGQNELFEKVWSPHHRRHYSVKAKLHHLDVPVRAMVLPLDDDAALQIHGAIRRALHDVLSEDSIWWQPENLMHATMWHASSYEMPVPATPQQISDEAAAVAQVAANHCPVKAVLDRIVVTSSGAVIACWQVVAGSSEPAALRADLQAALPNAPPPEKQVIRYPAMLHTTVARIMAPPKHPESHGVGKEWTDLVWLQSALVDAAAEASDELCGLLVTFNDLWFVEERDLMALALNGHYSKHNSHLKCPRHPKAPATATV